MNQKINVHATPVHMMLKKKKTKTKQKQKQKPNKQKQKQNKTKNKKNPIIQLSYKKLKNFVLILNDNATSRTVVPVKNT